MVLYLPPPPVLTARSLRGHMVSDLTIMTFSMLYAWSSPLVSMLSGTLIGQEPMAPASFCLYVVFPKIRLVLRRACL